MFDELYSDPARLEQFMQAMQGISLGNFHALAEKFDFSKYQTLCDVGGATGQLCTIVAARHEQLRCTSYDLPVVAPIAERAIAASGMADRVSVASGDFLEARFPGGRDHDGHDPARLEPGSEDAADRAAYEALPEGGAFIVIENLIDDARRENAFGLMMSLNMLIEFGDAFDYSGSDFAGWCRRSVFGEVEIWPLAGPSGRRDRLQVTAA